MTTARRVGFAVGSAMLALALGLTTLELVLRWFEPPPRVVLVRGSRVRDFHVDHDGVPLWDYASPNEERPRTCPERIPGAPVVLMVGSSITYGSGVTRDETVSARLETALADRSVCVENRASPGFGLDQQLATARAWAERLHPAVVIFEIWDPARHMIASGDLAFDARNRRVVDGVPVLPGVPHGLARLLFRASHAYQYATFAVAPLENSRDGSTDPTFLRARDVTVPAFRELGEHHGARVIALRAASLAAPLDEPERSDAKLSGMVADRARAEGLIVVDARAELADQDVTAIRLNTCCHLNPAGHAILGERMAPYVAAALDQAP